MACRTLIALSIVLLGCTAAVSPVGGPAAPDDGGLLDGGLVDGGALFFDAGPPLYDFTPFLDGGTFSIGGQPVAVIYWDGGTKTVVFPGPAGKGPLLTILYPDANHTQATGDQNSDGVIDYQYTSVLSGGTLTQTEQWDHDFDGVFDDISQSTTSPGDGGGPLLTETETQLINSDGGRALPDAGGSWVVTASYQGSAYQWQSNDCPHADGCDGFDGLPTNPPQSFPVPGHPHMAVPINVTGACPTAYAEKYATALQASLDQLYDCLNAGANQDAFNFLAWAKLLTAESMLTESNTNLYLFCNDSCTCTLAGTLPYGSFSQAPTPGQNIGINLRSPTVNPPAFGTLTDDQLTETLTHELLHFAGFAHDPQEQGTPPGQDLVYSCGRYCNACRSCATFGGTKTPEGLHHDCAECADDDHRWMCGFNYVTTPAAACNQTLADCQPACGSCDDITVYDCDSKTDPIYEPNELRTDGQCSEDASCTCGTCAEATILNSKDGCTQMPAGICAFVPTGSCAPGGG